MMTSESRIAWALGVLLLVACSVAGIAVGLGLAVTMTLCGAHLGASIATFGLSSTIGVALGIGVRRQAIR
jgi:hypothetical protein